MSGTSTDHRSLASALVVVIIWSTSFSFAKEAIDHLGPWLFRCYSMAIGVLPLLPFVRRSLVDLRQMAPLQRRYLLCMIVAGLACLFTPIGTILGVFTLVVLLRPQVKAAFAGQAGVA